MTTLPFTRAGPRVLVALLAAAAILASAYPARAGDEEKALELYQQAVDLAKENNYDEALPLFEEAYELGAPPVVLYNIARCYESMGKFEMAVDYYQRYIDSPGAEGTEDVVAAIEDLEAKPSLVSLATEPPGAGVLKVLSDSTTSNLGSTPLEFSADAGSHTYLIEKDGYKTKKIKLKTGLGKPYDLEIQLTPSKKKKEKKKKEKKPARTPLGLTVEAGGGVVLHAFKGTALKAGGDVSVGLGWRFAHGTDTGFSVGLRTSFRPYRLSATGESREYKALFTTLLAVPAFQIRLGERFGIEASVPLGIAVLTPLDTVPETTEIELVGGTIEGGGIPLIDIGFAACLRIMLVSSLYLSIEPVHLHLLIPTGRGWSGTKVPIDYDIVVRLGFEI